MVAAAAAKLLQSCPTLCNPIDGSPPGFPVPGILQARTLEWVAISLSNAWKWKVKVKLLSHVRLFATPWTAAHQAPPSMGVSRQEYWSGVPLPSPTGDPSFPLIRKPVSGVNLAPASLAYSEELLYLRGIYLMHFSIPLWKGSLAPLGTRGMVHHFNIHIFGFLLYHILRNIWHLKWPLKSILVFRLQPVNQTAKQLKLVIGAGTL